MSLSCLEISSRNALHNVKAFRSRLKPGIAIAGVVKGNAYGHGLPEMVGVLDEAVEYFQVDDLLELRSLRLHTKKAALVLGYVAKGELEEALTLGAEMAIYDTERLPELGRLAKKLALWPRLHLKIDTFLGRQGLLPKEVDNFLKELTRFPALELAGVYSHFANIEDTSDFGHAQLQIDTLDQAVRRVREHGHPDVMTHISSTSGVLAYESQTAANPLVRIGLGLYGMWPSEALKVPGLELKPVARWVTHVAQVKTVPAGFPIGYGLTYRTQAETRVAIVPQGYSDGYLRAFSNKGEVLIRGTRCPVLGRVAMNMFAVDASNLPDLRPEEEVVLLGSQLSETLTAEELAGAIGTINYEITTLISPLLPRVVT